MASKTSNWTTVVASAAISMMMGAAAFAAPASAFEGAGRTAASEGQRQARQVTNSVRSTDDASDVISKVLRKVASNLGTKVAEVKQQARDVLSQVS